MLNTFIIKEQNKALQLISDPFESIRHQLKEVETQLLQSPPDQEDWLVNETTRIFNAGGKRIRPALTLLVTNMLNSDPNRSISLAAGVEMLHSATLVHDDLIDKADTRRGVATTNAAWSTDAAILMGDYLFARAAKLVAQSDNVRIMDLFAQTLMVILNGEIAQRSTRWQVDRVEYQRRIYSKTAAVFVLAVQAAAVLGEASIEIENSLIEFGSLIGMAFQIIDDILDFSGSKERIGKPIGGDLRQGIITLPAINYYESNPQDDDMRWLLNNKQANPEIVGRLLEKIRTSSAIESSFNEAENMISKAIKTISLLPRSNYTHTLIKLSKMMVKRNF